MKVLSALEAESALRLLGFGFTVDEVVLAIQKRRIFCMAPAIVADVREVNFKEEKRKKILEDVKRNAGEMF